MADGNDALPHATLKHREEDDARPKAASDTRSSRTLRGGLLTTAGEASLFWWLRRRVLAGLVRQSLATSRLRLSVLLVLSVVFWGGLYILFAEGFELLRSAIAHVPTQAQTVQSIYNVFFISLLAMLTVSSAIILYSGLYRSEEAGFLLSTPTSARRIVTYKFQEAVIFSCWGFLLLGSPMLVAYGMVFDAPWHYFAMLLPFMISFVFIPASVGALFCLLVVYHVPHIRVHALVLAGVLLAVLLLGVFWNVVAWRHQDIMTLAWLDDMLARLEFAEQRMLPSWWLSSGLLEAAQRGPTAAGTPAWRESIMFLGVLISNALLFVLVFVEVGHRVFRTSYSRLRGLSSPRRRVRPVWIDRTAMRFACILPLPNRLLMIKDLRIFRRDPVQWSQFVIFFGLLALYFLNIRRFQYGEPLHRWMNVIGFLNLGVVGLILSTFTTRFIFPMVSMEGRRFWILGSLPLSRDTILWSKLAFACGVSILPCSMLILLSDVMLGIAQGAPGIAAIHQVTCWVLCIGLSSIAVGLGSRLPNLRESSPSKIAAGFGGTLNLVLSALFIVAVVLTTAVPCCLLLEGRETDIQRLQTRSWFQQWTGLGTGRAVVLGVVLTLILGVVATIVPLRIGFRAFRKLDF